MFESANNALSAASMYTSCFQSISKFTAAVYIMYNFIDLNLMKMKMFDYQEKASHWLWSWTAQMIFSGRKLGIKYSSSLIPQIAYFNIK
jgi:hypothetical protein